MSKSEKANCKQSLIMINLTKFFCGNNIKNAEIMLPIINGASKISLRAIDWFVTNYSKKKYCL